MNVFLNVATTCDRAIAHLGGAIFGGVYFLTTLPKIADIYNLYTLRADISKNLDPHAVDRFDLSRLADRCKKIYPSVSYATKVELQELEKMTQHQTAECENFTDKNAHACKGMLVQIEKVRSLLLSELVHNSLDLFVGMMGGLLCAFCFVVVTPIFVLIGTIATALFWGIWIVSEIPKIIRAFKANDPAKWIHLIKFLAALVIFGGLMLTHMVLPIGPIALLVSAVLGGLYILSQYTCSQAIAAHTKTLDMQHAALKPPREEIALTNLKRVPAHVATSFFIK